jgi:hypothetical protein
MTTIERELPVLPSGQILLDVSELLAIGTQPGGSEYGRRSRRSSPIGGVSRDGIRAPRLDASTAATTAGSVRSVEDTV